MKTFGSSLLVDLPDDILVIIGKSLTPRDIFNLSVCCRSLSVIAVLENLWQTQCEALGVVSSRDLVEWRRAVLSYKSLCRFLFSVKPLLGLWVHENPSLGNVVYVMPGFASVVGCGIIPQCVGPLGIDHSPILWAPVFEVISDDDGTPAFVLHGRVKEQDFIYPGTFTSLEKIPSTEGKKNSRSVEKMFNVLSLEVEHRMDKSRADFVETGRKILGLNILKSKPQRFVDQASVTVPFSKLSFGCKIKLFEIVTKCVCVQVSDRTCAPLFPCLRSDGDKFWKDVAHLSERRALLNTEKKFLDCSSDSRHAISGADTRNNCARRKTLVDCVKDSIRKLFRRYSSKKGDSFSHGDFKCAELHDFLSSGYAIGLTLHASTVELSSNQAWPCTDDNRFGSFSLYKLVNQVPISGQEYAGLWGGIFSSPETEGESQKALSYLFLSYSEKTPGKRLLRATIILQGSNSHEHPSGSAMFTVNVDEPSTESLPWDAGAYSHPIAVKQAFTGIGFACTYTFRNPTSRYGSLFALEDGTLVFLWKETRTALTLQRLNLEELLKKGVRVPALSPLNNFSYLSNGFHAHGRL